MIWGRLLDLPCKHDKQIMSKHYCFKKVEITRFQSFLKFVSFPQNSNFHVDYVVQLKSITTFPIYCIFVYTL